MASELIRGISAVICEVTKLRALHAMSVGALELRVRVARLDTRRAQCHVVLVRAVTAVVHTITHLVSAKLCFGSFSSQFSSLRFSFINHKTRHLPRYTSVIVTVESSQSIAVEVRTYRGGLVRAIPTVIGAIT